MDYTPAERAQWRQDGYALLRQAIPSEWLGGLREAFDAQVVPSHGWPVPREASWRFSMLDLEPQVQAVCRLPALLAVVGELIGERFFLAQVEGLFLDLLRRHVGRRADAGNQGEVTAGVRDGGAEIGNLDVR